jgi:trigger factor
MTDKETNNNEQPTNEEEVTETATGEQETEEKEFEFVEAPTFDVQYKGDCAYEVKVSVPVANERKLTEDTLEELRKKVEMPGFRRGKAPKKLVERKFSRAIKSDVEGQLAAAAFKKLTEEQKLTPLGQPDVEGLEEAERAEDQPLDFTLKFEVKPKIELGKYRGLEIERPVPKTASEDVERVIENTRSRFGVFETVTSKRDSAKDGDQVVIDFKGTIEGEPFPGGSATDYPYIIGSKRFFPEFEEALKGAKTGKTVTCKVTFPEDYSAANLQGKTADFEITIKELKRKAVPELTDEFAKQAGFENVDEMRKKIEERLKEDAQRRGNEIAEDRALRAIIDSSTFEFPKSLVESVAHDAYENRMRELREARVPVAQVEERDAQIREGSEKVAVNTLKTWLVLNEIAEAEGIEVTDEDFSKEAVALARRTGATLDAATQYLGEEGRRGSVGTRIIHEKALAAVLSHATIKDKELSEEEFQKEMHPEEPQEEN